MSKPRKNKKNKETPAVRALQLEDLESILERTKTSTLSEEEREKLTSAVETLAFLTQEIERKGVTILRLRSVIWGLTSEKTKKVLGEAKSDDTALPDKEAQDSSSQDEDSAITGKAAKEGAKGHGRNPVEAYNGAKQEFIHHKEFCTKDACPICKNGKLHKKKPVKIVRVTGVAPLFATTYSLERFRCNLCGKVFVAEAPPEIGTKRYDETAAAMIAILKYGCGLPFYRLEQLEGGLGIPMPTSTQWDVVSEAADLLKIAHQELERQAAQGDVLYNDDTSMKILNLPFWEPERGEKRRTGIHTTCVVSTLDDQKIALFFTGRKHAGENLADLIAKRSEDLATPIQMCDALSRNTKGDFDTIVANCLAHGRRKFTDVAVNFPKDCLLVLEWLGSVYGTDAQAREEGLSPQDRLILHQEKSKPVMEELSSWMKKQLDEKLVEENSGLGEAIRYMQNHWERLTLFLREEGAPLDNNICERALKKAILHRKNALFYRSKRGAEVGDLFMSLIHSTELTKENPFEYLVALQRHPAEVKEKPGDWMPWNFREAMAAVKGDEENSESPSTKPTPDS